ncbi:MAG: arylamine N-acetyltransferase [Chloroflexota bacterium]|nr:MAG: arylamine N-acetyltransferase [Chloroflexota bacterium]
MTDNRIGRSAAAAPGLDLDAYFRRIGYAGPREPTLGLLREIVLRHTQTIPFENLNPWLRWPVYLDLPSLQHKIVRRGRGGYCFEQNGLLRHVLLALSFTVTPLAARVLWMRPPDAETPRSHMLLLVTVEGQPYIVDVGFGGMTPTGVLRLEPEVPQATPHEPYRLMRAGDSFVLQAEVRGEWGTLYRFDLHEQLHVDYEVANWYVSTHPQSHFVTGLSAARAAPDRRYTLSNTRLAVHHRGGHTEQHQLTSVEELRAALQDTFLLTLPEEPALDIALQRLVDQAREELR